MRTGRRHRLRAAAALAAAALACAPAAAFAAGAPSAPAANASVSANWAGYAVTGARGLRRHFHHIAGAWVAPTVRCTAGKKRRYVAFWIGLGGFSAHAKALEQTGTEGDCDRAGHAHYGAWFELVPAGPVRLCMAIAPGDRIRAAVTVGHHEAVLTLTDRTSHVSITRRLRMRHPDTTSAEWIAEAPSNCDGQNCRALPLSNFRSVTFTGARARLHDGSAGAIRAPALWRTYAISLREPLHRPRTAGRVLGARTRGTATPTILARHGRSFTLSCARRGRAAAPAARSRPARSPSSRRAPGRARAARAPRRSRSRSGRSSSARPRGRGGAAARAACRR